MKILAGCIIFGIILLVAPSIPGWLMGIDITNPQSGALPGNLVGLLEKLLTAVQWAGAFLLVFGLIYGGYEYVKEEH